MCGCALKGEMNAFKQIRHSFQVDYQGQFLTFSPDFYESEKSAIDISLFPYAFASIFELPNTTFYGIQLIVFSSRNRWVGYQIAKTFLSVVPNFCFKVWKKNSLCLVVTSMMYRVIESFCRSDLILCLEKPNR